MEHGLTPQRVVAELTRSPHGKLSEYVPIAEQAAREQAEFLARLIAWNERNGQIRDSKVALPVASLVPEFPLAENSLAHLALLDPRNLVRALRFARELKRPGRALQRLTERYLRAREANHGWFVATAVQHRASLQTLYALQHIKPSEYADAIIFKGSRPAGSVFEAIAGLPSMPPNVAAEAIVRHRIPFLVATAALGKRLRETDLVLALIQAMSPAELVTNTKMLERLGIKEQPALRAAYEAGLQRVAESKSVTLKTTRAAQAMTDPKLKAKLVATQEKQLQTLGGIDGNWLVLGDKSASMHMAIETARQVAATLAKMVTGQVTLVFFDTAPRAVEVTGMTYEQILEQTRYVQANGGTSIGCGVQYALDRHLDVQGIAVVSDGAENSAPMFSTAYGRLCKQLDAEIPVYLYWLPCYMPDAYQNNPESMKRNMDASGLDLQVFDLRHGTVDYYALPAVISTMKASRYKLLDDIMSAPLLTLDDVFKEEEKSHVAA